MALFLTLAVAIPLLILDPFTPTARGHADGVSLFARALVVLFTALQLSLLMARGEPRWFATVMWSFAYVWLGLAGLAQLIAGRNPFGYRVESDRDFETSMVILVGLFVGDIVYRGVSRRSLRAPKPPIAPIKHERVVSPNRVLLFVAASTVTTPVLLQLQGGFGTYLHTRDAVRASLDAVGSLAVSGVLRAATQVPPLVALLGVLAVLAADPRRRRSPTWWAAFTASLVLNVVVNNPIGNSRFWFGTVVLGCLFTLPWFRTPRGFRLVLVGLIVALSVVFPYSDYFRTEGGFEQRRQAVSTFMVEKLDYDATAQISYSIKHNQIHGPDYGRQLLGAVGFVVPRAIWQNKPNHTGEILAETSGFHFKNVSAPLWAEGYVAAGLAGVVLLLGAWGAVAGTWDRRFVEATAPLAWAPLFAAPLAAYSMIVLRGALLPAMALGVVLCFALVALGSRSTAPTSQQRVDETASASRQK